jgi:phosphate:Na+ symporter
MTAMPGHLILLNLFGGVALLLWGTHMVQAAVLCGFGVELRAAIGHIAGRPVRAAATGVAAAAMLQSATAAAMLLAAFVARRIVAPGNTELAREIWTGALSGEAARDRQEDC